MTTFFDAMSARLSENGLFDDHVKAIMALAVEDESLSDMKHRWLDDVDGYPGMLTHVTYRIIEPIAYKWICENIPQAWFRPVFSPGIHGLKGKELEDYIADYQKNKQGFGEPAQDNKG